MELDRHVRYSSISACIANEEYEYGLALIAKKLKVAKISGHLEDECWYYLLIAYTYYRFGYLPLCIQYSQKALKHSDIVDDCIIIEAYLIRSIAHLAQGKYQRVYDAIQECLTLNPRNEDVLKMLEVLKMKGFN